MTHIDGNAAPDDVFARDLSAASATCEACGQTGPVAAAMVYESMGSVLRCPSCDAILMRVVQHGTETCVDMRGLRVLRWR
jgi:Zn finger protein HypA/HybF involved in hydrogenase expression